jgi:hypothetical protein
MTSSATPFRERLCAGMTISNRLGIQEPRGQDQRHSRTDK